MLNKNKLFFSKMLAISCLLLVGISTISVSSATNDLGEAEAKRRGRLARLSEQTAEFHNRATKLRQKMEEEDKRASATGQAVIKVIEGSADSEIQKVPNPLVKSGLMTLKDSLIAQLKKIFD